MKCSITWLYWFVGIIIFCIDRITKNAALVSFLERVESGIPLLSYEMTFNRGISWGIFNFENQVVFMFISIMIALATCAVAWYAHVCCKRGEPVLGHVLIIIGSVSNLIDRVVYHGVIDFILISFRDYSWPIFNVADMAIVVGILILVWQHVFSASNKNI